MASNTSLIYVDHHNSSPISIRTETYEQIKALIEANRACFNCGAKFTEENPRVAFNKCLKCVLEKHQSFTYIGLAESGSSGNYYSFIDAGGYVHTTYQGKDDSDPPKSDYETMKYCGFPTLASYTYKEKERPLDRSYWSIYGNFRENDVIVATWYSSYAGLSLAFLSCKDGTIIEINRRMKEYRELFKAAKAVAEATKDTKGFYHVGDYATSELRESQLYAIISDIATQEYREHYIERKRARVNELVQAWLSRDDDPKWIQTLSEIVSIYEELQDTKNVTVFRSLLALEQKESSV